MKNKNKIQISSAIIWGVELSPFVLKMQAYLEYCGIPYRRLPAHGSYLENTQTLLRLEYQKQHKQISRYPEMDADLDEYPAVPFFTENGKDFQYDSTAIAHYLDQKPPTQGNSHRHRLFPEDPCLNFIASLIDEAFDEFGLYMVHHMRWVGSAKSNIMGKLLAKEFRHALPPGGPLLLSRRFPKRQVARCPYLFSVAPKSYRSGVSKALSPPYKEGFPETHTLLFESWKQYLKGMEEVLTLQKFLLGDQFTIADASAYGQLAMNLVDPETNKLMQELAPQTHAWLEMIYSGKHRLQQKEGELYFSGALKPLLNTIMSTYASLMVQNKQAYHLAKAQGATEF
ncbi:hypothetical protein A3755_15965, partial [Oleiphilus sp. HI0085]